ncbi:hypothetical protein ACFL6U_15155 [Planctomycetota bacterium]
MDSTEFSLIRPVQKLKQAADARATERHEKRKKRRNARDGKNNAEVESPLDSNDEVVVGRPVRDDDPHSIDFCA